MLAGFITMIFHHHLKCILEVFTGLILSLSLREHLGHFFKEAGEPTLTGWLKNGGKLQRTGHGV